jgi:hypothetical protein
MQTKLWEAIDYLEEHGWCQRRSSNYEGRVCLLAALFRVYYPGRLSVPLFDDRHERDLGVLGRVALEQFPTRMPSIPHGVGVTCFNDHEDTTYEDVILVAKMAAVEASTQVSP